MKATQLRFGFAPRPPTPREEFERMLREALAGPDPADERMPQVGDTIEVLWKAPRWYRGVVMGIWSGIMMVRMTEIGPYVIWDAPVTRADARRVYSVQETAWRWPRREGETA